MNRVNLFNGILKQSGKSLYEMHDTKRKMQDFVARLDILITLFPSFH